MMSRKRRHPKTTAAVASVLLCAMAAPTTTTAFVSVGSSQTKTSSTGLFGSHVLPLPLPGMPLPALFDILTTEAPAVTPKRTPKQRVRPTTAASFTTRTAYTTRTAPPSAMVPNEDEVLRRKLEWAGRYTSVEALRETFGTNQNRLWGDMQATTARRLYKTLLPRALLELSQLGVGQLQPQDLAPLAYQARLAAKMYARERCTVPARIGATVFDGFRQWIKYGRFQGNGMTYDQIWEKYADQIIAVTEEQHEHDGLSEQVCRKILERACVSNEGVDKLILNETRPVKSQQQQLLEQIHSQLEQDMYELLLPEHTAAAQAPPQTVVRRRPWSQRNHVLIVKALAKQQRLLELRAAKAPAALRP